MSNVPPGTVPPTFPPPSSLVLTPDQQLRDHAMQMALNQARSIMMPIDNPKIVQLAADIYNFLVQAAVTPTVTPLSSPTPMTPQNPNPGP